MFTPKLFSMLLWAVLFCSVISFTAGSRPNQLVKPYKREPLQNVVTWDEHSLFVRGERIMLFNGEFHPFRLPVPSLWLDVFQKIKVAGFSGVSFYTHWALLEGKPGNFSAEGVFALESFFEAASRAGIYLVARPGPYINAELTGGGFPGWLQREKVVPRTPAYLPLTANYVQNIGKILSKAQITNGGPIILVQPENEYTAAASGVLFPDHEYFAAVEDGFRDAGIVVPFVSNDAIPEGHNAPGTGLGAVDIYGHDGYPSGLQCAQPYSWPAGTLPTNYLASHLAQSPSTPYTISEFMGGSSDPWGGPGYGNCETLANPEFERVFYKNNYAIAVTIFNIYMVYGGTNWGNLGHSEGYTSYDFGAAIAEDRTLTREKYSEIKLQANFLKVSPAYLVGRGGYTGNGSYVTSAAIATTRLASNVTNFYVTRQANYSSLSSVKYNLIVPTSIGSISIPQLNNSTLTLDGRDSKIHSVDYDVGGITMLYSTAEIFTWKKYQNSTVLILYGGLGETHEAAFKYQPSHRIIEGHDVTVVSKNETLIFNWAVTSERKIIKVDDGLYLYLLSRSDVYNYWVIDLPNPPPADSFTAALSNSIIARAGYLLRTASVINNTLALTGDLNATTTIEIIAGFPARDIPVTFNGRPVIISHSTSDTVYFTVSYTAPLFTLPDLTALSWKYINSLPEVLSNYSDSAWPLANHTSSNNIARNLTTTTSLYGSDYGFNTGNLLFRGHFVATGAEKSLSVQTQGGTAFASAIWLNSTFLDGFSGNNNNALQPTLVPGEDDNQNFVHNITLPPLRPGAAYVLTVLIDNMGFGEDFAIGTNGNSNPRGILDYNLSGRNQSGINWKITGNLGGEDYLDRTRGPLNEGGLWAERQGFHLPDPPSQNWESRSPISQGISAPGVGFYTTSFELNMPVGYDIPLAFVFNMTSGAHYRSQLYVNGYQFGKFVNNIGPQTSFPVPEGILNYHGSNTVALSLWGFDTTGNRIADLALVATAQILTGYEVVQNSPMPKWTERRGAY